MKSPRLCLALLILCVAPAFAETRDEKDFTFVAWNAPALMSFFPTGFVTRSILPTALCNQEAGIALSVGHFGDSQAVEGRLSVGNSNRTYIAVQAQAGWNWFLGEGLWGFDKGPYVGAELRYWDLIQTYSGVESNNIAPLVDFGWWFDFGTWFIDLRLSQVFAIASFSSIAHSVPGFEIVFSPLPGIAPWIPMGLVQVGLKLY